MILYYKYNNMHIAHKITERVHDFVYTNSIRVICVLFIRTLTTQICQQTIFLGH